MWGFSNAHFQTIAPSLLVSKSKAKFVHEVFELDDGDFVDLAWHGTPEVDDRDIIVLLHGLEGSVYSPYAFLMMQALDRQGFNSVVMHHRGCFKAQNRLARAYHSGETGDARAFISDLHQRYPQRKLAAIGYSLGGNMLMKLQGEWGDETPLFAAVSVSAPLRLSLTADHINQGLSRFYQYILMKDLKNSLLEKYNNHDYETLIGLKKELVPSLKSFWEYDDLFTGPIHGFKGADEYYERSSAYPYLTKIRRPTLIIHAKDDPFMPVSVLPTQEMMTPHLELSLSDHGGHVGFIGGTPLAPKFWLCERIPRFFKEKMV